MINVLDKLFYFFSCELYIYMIHQIIHVIRSTLNLAILQLHLNKLISFSTPLKVSLAKRVKINISFFLYIFFKNKSAFLCMF